MTIKKSVVLPALLIRFIHAGEAVFPRGGLGVARYSGALRLLTPFLSVPEMNLPALNLNVTRKSRSDYLYSRMGNRQGAEGTQISAVDIPLSTADIPLSAADILLSAADILLSAADILLSAADIPLSTADIPLSAADISLSAADISLFMMVKKSLKMAGKPVKPDSRIKKTKKEGT